MEKKMQTTIMIIFVGYTWTLDVLTFVGSVLQIYKVYPLKKKR